MYIQNATYKTIPTEGLTFPLEAGTVLTVNNITGIVPENVAVPAPTGVLYLAVGGTIDLTSEANAGITFTDAELNALSGDFNFIPLAESGGSSLPAYTSADKGKVLTIGGGEGEATVIIPLQEVPDVQVDESGASARIFDDELYDALHTLSAGDNVELKVNGNTYSNVVVEEIELPPMIGGTAISVSGSIDSVDGPFVKIEALKSPGTGEKFVGFTYTSASGLYPNTYTIYLAKINLVVTPKWENAGMPDYSNADKGKVLTIGEGEGSVTTVIVPEQTVTVSGEPFIAALAGVDTSFFGTLQDGDAVPFVVDGATITGTVHINAPMIAISNPEYPFYILYTSEDAGGFSAGTYFQAQSGGTHTVSLTASVPKIEAKWETGGDVKYIFIGSPDGNNSADYGIYSDESLSNQLDENACNTLIDTLETSTIICRIPRGGGRYYEYRGYWTNSRNKVLFVVELSGSSLRMKTVGYIVGATSD